MTPKQTRTAQIAQITTCIADYYKVQASHIIDDTPRKAKGVMSARRLLCYHLHKCGMGYDMLSKLLKRDVHTVRNYTTEGFNLVIGGMRDFVDELPKVTTTLEIKAVSQPTGKTD